MNRIRPEQVIAAKEATGFDVAQYKFFDERDGQVCLCGLSLVAVHRGLNWLELKNAKHSETESGDTQKQLELVCAQLELSPAYASGFYDGFDGEGCYRDEENDLLTAGMIDGRDCAVALGLLSPRNCDG